MRIDRLLVPSMAVLGPQQLQGSYHTLFTFGDSYTSTKFDTSGSQPALDNPMGNPDIGQGTTAGGINWAGYLTTVYNDTVVLNYNLAVFGATVDNSILDGEPIDLVDQVSRNFGDHYCSSLLESSPGWKSDTALFAIWIGINERDTHQESVLELNCQLQRAVLDWRMGHRDSAVTVYDSWSFMNEVLDHPAEYGFLDNSCMGTYDQLKFGGALCARLLEEDKVGANDWNALMGFGFSNIEAVCMYVSFALTIAVSVPNDSSTLPTARLCEEPASTHKICCTSVQADLADPKKGSDLILQAAKNLFGSYTPDQVFQVDILINNAGISSNQHMNDEQHGPIDPTEFDRVYKANVLAPLLLTKAVAPYLPKDRSGRIVTVSSVSSSIGYQGQSVYAGSKAAVEAMTRVMEL
ncbi:uncharacterized protein KD926_000358 [Aspergillus affinis]|uniref:uncharacterized protein n=1 Tax=Aspergillus affinis TaxID=1070780 RepID=UPI0022FDF9BA|nr:uncharacterized protein KD926_000358 [Aspergillus affinis]KAI9037395.1 hypothetical protein KD926_000358 [Aspergillus affinis]